MAVTVSVWWIDLGSAPAPTPRDLDMLSLAERERHARYLRPEPARIFAATRLALRCLLAQRLGSTAAAVPIALGAHGKPVVANAPALHFNVSHCATGALIALCDAGEVGVDVEQAGALGERDAVATSICTPTETAWLRAHPAASARLLTRLWTRKEAILKACGIGLAHTPATIDLGALDATQGHVELAGLGRVDWRDLALPCDDVASVAVVGAGAAGIDVTVQVDAPWSFADAGSSPFAAGPSQDDPERCR